MNIKVEKSNLLRTLIVMVLFLMSCGSVDSADDSVNANVDTVVNISTNITTKASYNQPVTDVNTVADTTLKVIDTNIVQENITSTLESTPVDITEGSQSVSVSDKVQKILSDMSLEEKVYQMFIVTPEQLTGVDVVVQASESTQTALELAPVGGIIYFGQNLQNDSQTTQMLSNTQKYMKDINGIGLFLCVDEEGGYVARIGDHLTSNQFNYMNTYGQNPDSLEAYQIGVELAENLSTYGFNVDFAPVSDVDLNVDNGLHEYGRCFSDDPNSCAIMVDGIVRGIQDNGISATIKHFPGLGSTTGDTHNDIIYLDRSKEELETVDFIPIKAGIDAGVDFVMVSHMVVNGLSDNVPCDLSKTIVTNWLRNDLNFDGIVITDSHQMSAITNYYTSAEASVMAIQAGIDIVLMPDNLENSVDAIVDAVTNGKISEEQIEQSVTRILTQKEEFGLLY